MKFGFIYITTCLVNNKKYLGQRKYSRGWKDYIGSGVAFQKAVEKYGKENFRREIICEAETAEELNKLEYELSQQYDVVNSEEWYNLCYGGYSTNGFKFSEDSKRVMSEKKKGLYDGNKNPMYGVHRKLTEEHKRKISLNAKNQWGEKNWMYGKVYGENPRARAVICVETGVVYDSAKRAAHEMNVNYSNLLEVVKGKRKRVGGLHFEYASKQANTEITA
jgi:group I intron endonuclease